MSQEPAISDVIRNLRTGNASGMNRMRVVYRENYTMLCLDNFLYY
jgi:hypothetical protein